MSKRKGNHIGVSAKNLHALLAFAVEIEKKENPKSTSLKRIVDDCAAANSIADIVIADHRCGIVPHKSGLWGVSISLFHETRVFYPVCWTGDCGDRINCWYRIK
jgi:hypothetical protein